MDKQHPTTDFAVIADVTNVNHKPHPFMVGTKHVAWASEHNMGSLDESVIARFPCEMKGCGLSYSAHTSDRVAFIRLTRNCTKAELSAWATKLEEEGWIGREKVDGFTFLETPEKYRVQ